MFKKLLNNKNKLIELTKTPLNENCSAVVLKKLPEKLGGRDFDSEEIENFLNKNSISLGVEDSPFNMEEDIFFLESLLREEPCPNPPIIPNQTESSIKEPKHSFKMGYEHFNTNLVTNDVAESSTKNLLPILHECKESNPHQEEIDVVTVTDDVLPPSVENDDSDGEVDAVDVLRVDNFIQNSEHEYSDFDNPSIPLPPPEPPDKEFDFGVKISVVRNTIVRFECIDARVVFNDENDDLSYFMFVIFDKMFSLLFAESEDMIFDPDISD
nr:reverse transcriptase domain-containing protein [Tanacetum cinerariifolium]